MDKMTAGEAAEILEALPNNSDEYKQYAEVNPNYILISPYCMKAFKVAASILRRVESGELREVVHRHWIDTGFANSTGDIYECSNCHKLYNPEKKAVVLGRQEKNPANCPYCGALMNGKDDSRA